MMNRLQSLLSIFNFCPYPLAQNFTTIFVSGVPKMSLAVRDQARRFITLVDEAYNHGCVLVCSAEAPPDELFTGGGGVRGDLDDGAGLIDLESLQFEGEAGPCSYPLLPHSPALNPSRCVTEIIIKPPNSSHRKHAHSSR